MNNNGVHACVLRLCVCACALLRGLCVRGVEHLNINNCHVGHLGPHSQLAPWAHSHHQHSCHGEREREEGDVGEGVGDERTRDTHKHTRLCEEVIVPLRLGMVPKMQK